jgi:hypothetical protein
MLIIVLHKEQLNKILKSYIILTWQLRLKKDENALMRLFLAKHMYCSSWVIPRGTFDHAWQLLINNGGARNTSTWWRKSSIADWDKIFF